MANTLSILSIVSFALAGISFVLAVFFWFKFDIPNVYGDLSGRNAQKSIEQMRANNLKAGNQSYRSSPVNVARGKLTSPMTTSDLKTKKTDVNEAETDRLTDVLSTNKAVEITSATTVSLEEDYETELLESEPIEKGQIKSKQLKMIDEVIYIHTDEIIN